MVSKVQKFQMRVLNRTEIHGAPYNPRTIDRHAKAKLEKNLRKTGLIQPLVWNEVTGNLVSGHQRMTIIDSIEGRKDYELEVAVVRMSEKEEKKQNIFLNNSSAQGTWDQVALEELLKDIGQIDIPDTGFDPMDIAVVFDSPELSKGFFDLEQQPKDVQDAVEDIEQIVASKAEDMEKIKAAKKAARESASNVDTEIFSVIAFRTRAEQTKFVELCGCDSNARYVDGAAVWRLLGIEP